MRTRTLLHISGGQDSTYVLYHWLKNNRREKILLHHVRLKHIAEDREDVEQKAVYNILEWLTSKGLTNFTYHESSFDWGTLPIIKIKDIVVCSLFTANILRTDQWRKIDTLLLSWHLGEVNHDEINRGFRVKKLLDTLEVGRPIKLEFPIEFLTRADMAANMPKELLDLTHSCRKPKEGNCMKCKTCMEMVEAGIY